MQQAQEATRLVKEGKLPTTDQAAQLLQRVQTTVVHEARRESKMSETGREVLENVENLMDTTRRILVEKNAGNDLQELLYVNLVVY
jgi:hypothetical protein